ncbi:MAG: phosphate butyryltransferase [Deltaproteobacteria bacterium]|nr:phosphate butyryltransferase [Deltaproteobacteria bacterium]
MISTWKELIERAQKAEKKKVIVAFPAIHTLDVIEEASRAHLISPVLVGNAPKIEKLVTSTSLAHHDYEIIDEVDRDKALAKAIRMARDNGDILMQGHNDHQTFVDAVLNEGSGLLNGRLASFVSIFQLLQRDKLILITDTYLNDYPSLKEKIAILENALELTDILEFDSPRKVAAIAAVEQINPSIPATVDAAIISKMSERKQFGNVVVEGALDMDCAVSKEAAARKGVKSIVTGNADIYLVPEVETGYLLSQVLVFIGKMAMAGVLAGTSTPAIINLPFVSTENKIAAFALASLMCAKGNKNT